ncbi:MAG: hypothetical protein KOO63_13380 [Bacteroidales bacterium]|nr:hypothetical protein [Candidatus Latescibacterota bacterium]
MENNNDSDLIEYAIINHYDEDPCDILDSLKNQLDKIARSLDSFLKLDLKEVKKLSPTDLDIPLSDEEEHALFFGWAVARVSPKRGAPEHSTELFFIGRLAKVYSDVIHKRPGASTSSIFPNLVDYVMMYINSFVTPDSDDNVQPHSYLRLVKKAVSRL